jgi:hypothetical protein
LILSGAAFEIVRVCVYFSDNAEYKLNFSLYENFMAMVVRVNVVWVVSGVEKLLILAKSNVCAKLKARNASNMRHAIISTVLSLKILLAPLSAAATLFS